MKKTLLAAALAVFAAPALALDVGNYTYEPLFSYDEMRAISNDDVRVRVVMFDAQNPDLLLLFADEGGSGESWLFAYDLGLETIELLGGDSLDNLVGEATTFRHGAIAAGAGLIAYHDNNNRGTIRAVEVATGTLVAEVIVDSALENVGSFAYLGNNIWAAPERGVEDGDLLLIDAGAGTVTTAVENLGNVTNLDVVGPDAVIVGLADGETIYHIADVTGASPVVTDVTPAGAAGRDIAGLAAVSQDVYAVLDRSPSGFNDDIIAIWDGTDLTDLVLSDIAPPGELYPNFHHGMAMIQPDPESLHLYIANFNNFVNEPAFVRLVWEDITSVGDWTLY